MQLAVFWLAYDSNSSFVNDIIFFFQSKLFSLQALLRIHKVFYASSFFVSWNADIIDIEKPHRIFLPIFVVDDFSELCLETGNNYFFPSFII